jgi:cobalamin biosynthetic protein CobC
MQHGGDLTTAMALHGGTRGDWLDLSTGINPHAFPLPDLPAEAWTALPDEGALSRLTDAARRAYRVPEGVGLVAAPGTQALIQWLPVLAPAGDVAVVGPTYGEHAMSWQRVGSTVQMIGDLTALPDNVRHVVVVNPNNPDGRWSDPAHLAAAARDVGARGGWLVVDESFLDLRPQATAASLCREAPVVVLRSFGKFFGLAGVRLGFAVAPPVIAGAIAAALGPWAVAGPALAIGAAALGDERWAETMRIRLREEASSLDTVLAEAGFAPSGGTDLYRLVRHPEARRIHEGLAAARIWVRRFDWDDRLLRFGLPAEAAGRDLLAVALRGLVTGPSHGAVQGTMTGSPACSVTSASTP